MGFNTVGKGEIAAIITHAAFYAGWPKGWAVFNLAKEVWKLEEGKEAIEMKQGDCINTPGEECSNEWCEPVPDEEYGKLK